MSNTPAKPVVITKETDPTELEERKRQLAYQYWEEEGRPEGRAETHWEKACLVVMNLDEGSKQEPKWLHRAKEQSAPAPQAATEMDSPVDVDINAIRRRMHGRNAA